MQRREGESFEDYKKRRAEDNAQTKRDKMAIGRKFWNSSKLGTYRKPKEN